MAIVCWRRKQQWQPRAHIGRRRKHSVLRVRAAIWPCIRSCCCLRLHSIFCCLRLHYIFYFLSFRDLCFFMSIGLVLGFCFHVSRIGVFWYFPSICRLWVCCLFIIYWLVFPSSETGVFDLFLFLYSSFLIGLYSKQQKQQSSVVALYHVAFVVLFGHFLYWTKAVR